MIANMSILQIKRIWIDMKKHRRPIENILEIKPILKNIILKK